MPRRHASAMADRDLRLLAEAGQKQTRPFVRFGSRGQTGNPRPETRRGYGKGSKSGLTTMIQVGSAR
jgi:hypothetical protein